MDGNAEFFGELVVDDAAQDVVGARFERVVDGDRFCGFGGMRSGGRGGEGKGACGVGGGLGTLRNVSRRLEGAGRQPSAVRVPEVDDCTACHASMKKPVSAKIHAGHLRKTECETCHELKDGALFVRGSSTAQGKVDESAWELYKEFYAGVGEEKGGFALHLRRGVSCEGCHGVKTPEEMTTVDNAACESCHGTVDEIAAKAVPAVKEQNPHKSHQGNLNCNQCHVGHGTTKSYCLECHQNFNQTMPEAK